jgi:hypothetical protein
MGPPQATEPGCGAEPHVIMKPEEQSRQQLELAGWPVIVETYRLGDVYHCTISNADPGARIARADGATRIEAEQKAIEKATRYLGQTRRFSTG